MTTTLTCPDAGAWRAWLDEPDPRLEAHLDACNACRQQVDDLSTNAAYAAMALQHLAPATLPSPAEAAAARQRLAARGQPAPGVAAHAAPRRGRRRLPGGRAAEREGQASAAAELAGTTPSVPAAAQRVAWRAGRTASHHLRALVPAQLVIPTAWRVAGSGLAAALLLTLGLTVSPEGRALAAQFLAQFRSQQVAPVEITPQSQIEIQRTISALSHLGLVRIPAARASAVTVGSLGEASQRVGFALKAPDPASLPPSLDRAPKIQVLPADQLRFTFDKAKARAYFQSTGHPEVTLPDRYDGASLVVSVPAAALLQYTGQSALLIGQSAEIAVGVEGPASLDELRDFLLSLPGLPRDTAAQLRSIANWRETLPIPIPTDRVHWQSVSFAGHAGLLLNDNSGAASAAIWQADGHLYGLAGSLKATDLQRVAASLR